VTHQAGHQSRVLPSFGVSQPGRHNWSLTGPGVRSGSRLCFTQPGSFASDAEARNDSLAETHQQYRYCERYCRAFWASVKSWPCFFRISRSSPSQGRLRPDHGCCLIRRKLGPARSDTRSRACLSEISHPGPFEKPFWFRHLKR